MQQLSFLPPAPFSPRWPTPGSMSDRALNWLLAGDVLDHPTFEARTASWRLAAYVRELRALGWPVETEGAAAPTADVPGRTIGRYTLPPAVAALARALRRG